MSIIGTFTKQENGGYDGTIETLTLNARATFELLTKRGEKSPDYRITSGTTDIGAVVRMRLQNMTLRIGSEQFCTFKPRTRRNSFSLLGEITPQGSSIFARSGWMTGANGFTTVTPHQVNPSCKSSDSKRRQPASAAAAHITASQIPIW